MNRKRTALAVTAGGTAAGVVGLVLLASPATAGQTPPSLPATTPEALVQSVLTAEVPAMAGTVEVANDLGLPLPGLPQGAKAGEIGRVYSDGQGRGRISVDAGENEQTIIRDGSTVWVWDSSARSVVKVDNADKYHGAADRIADPAQAARDLVGVMQQDSAVTVDGTARVADRPVYQLVLTPKPTERTLLREVRVAVDSETRLPLRLEVMANGQATPALRVGFTEFATGAQDPALFRFTPPAGAKVVTPGAEDLPSAAQQQDFLSKVDLKPVGSGWDTVLTGRLPKDVLSAPQAQGKRGDSELAGATPMELVKRMGTPVSGPFGSGWAINAKVGTAVVTEDGRVAVGAVPQQVLLDALGQK